MLHREVRDSIALLRMDHGKVSAIDVELFEALCRELDELKELNSVKALVLSGTGKAFSAGVDLFRVLDGGRTYLERFLPLLSEGLKKLFLFPKPTVAAVNGHAIAGGALLAWACDYRLMVPDGATIGVPELQVGVPFPPLALEIVRFAAGQHASRVALGAETYQPKQALAMGLMDELIPGENLLNRAQEVARKLSSVPADAYRITKFQLRGHKMPSDAEIMEQWSSPEIHKVIRAYLQRTLRK